MLKLNDKSQSTMKRLALSSSDASRDATGSAAKRLCPTNNPMFAKRLESVALDRQQSSSANNTPANASSHK